MSSEVTPTILEQVETHRSLQISIDSMSKGTDNYHIDVRLSRRFASDAKKLIALLTSQLVVPKPKNWDNSKLFE